MSSPLALAYVRVSTAGQVEHGASLEAQESALRIEADRRDWDIEIIREEGRSAKNLNRPALQDALTRLDSGKAQFLLAVRLDRVSRSVADFAELMKRSQRRGWGILFTTTNIDTTDASGRFAAHVVVAAAEFERDLISARTKEGMAQKKLEGSVFGRTVSPDFLSTYEAVLVMHADGTSYNAIASKLDASGIPTARGGKWAAATVRRMVLSETAKTLTSATA
jgi:DNA invertase Pin-like site-specific DNA recombinase